MIEKLEEFIQKIPEFDTLSVSEMIPLFVYYLTNNNDEGVTSKDIKICFEELDIQPYSNISAYLGNNVGKRNSIFLKSQKGYRLNRTAKVEIVKMIGEVPNIIISDELIPLEIFKNTRYYLEKMAFQMCACYQTRLYDASLVMMRKLVETLIIECFERYGIDNQIKDDNGTFFYLSDLIPLFVNNNKWNVSRNLKGNIEKIKKYGDLSAHNRRFIAKKHDFDEFKFELRQALQEIILIVDYSSWSKN